MSEHTLNSDPALLGFLAEFHSKRNYFECHEVLEHRWMADENRQDHWKGLLQLAVGCYHHRRGNFSGASKVYGRALNHLNAHPEAFATLGFLPDHLIQQTIHMQTHTDSHTPYQSIQLPMSSRLLTDYKTYCAEQEIVPFHTDPISDLAILDAHLPQYRN